MKKAAYDLRGRYDAMLRAEVASLLDMEGELDEQAVDEELRYLMELLANRPE